MKKSYLFFAASLAALSQVSFADTENPSTFSLFAEGSVGALYNHATGKYFCANHLDHINASSDNAAIDIGANVGFNIKNRVDIYIGADYANGAGHSYFNDGIGEDATDYYSYNFHIGALVFPFSSNSTMKGTFMGLELGTGIYDVTSDREVYLDEGWWGNLGVKVGHVWPVAKRLELGVEAYVDFHINPTDDDDSLVQPRLTDMSTQTFGINFIAISR